MDLTPRKDYFGEFDPTRVPTPCFVVDEIALRDNLEVLADVQKRSGAKVLAALKAFSMFSIGPIVAEYLSGTCASGINEAKLGFEEYGGKDQGKEVHVFSAGYKEAELKEILGFAHHVIFNSFSQWKRYRELCLEAQKQRPELQFGLRINPEHSEGHTPIYDPCAPCSRLGIVRSLFDGEDLTGISGLHFHTLCEQDFKPLERTIKAVEEKFGDLIPQMQWINFGGGHHITRCDYQVDELVAAVKAFSEKHGVQVYLEPGEAVALFCGVLVGEVVDLTWNGSNQAILDVSATCHMPDVIEMPYRPEITGASLPEELPHSYQLGGQSCLAGDRIGEYSFAEPLHIGDRIVFEEMAYYTMVKTNTFNGIPLPSIALWNSDTDELKIVKTFGYEDFKGRLS
ncbi:carboxynorspermidine decarboxylase [Microbulbifer hydrolyticus]|uniref:Carboxynorspermidine/carboxyspermidine decarboxylase n=1 Tax=Microbulbifer hydrolyticus TaxID=48074 RepID=A0A6P1T861_9GAMM|nr:carboxynorspermidine decarboxylase [Microbulbifer hydrolyticus]MBB5211334.1 carboxynorspermidine decarboxylase [Microbulbifer hydrolyticus]QHQ37905.1 carboxynorspermidine decarboxylase [Microbulbifer hydrolyticus]